MKSLFAGLAKSNKTIIKYLKQGIPSRSRKYKRIHNFVTRMSKGQAQEAGQTSDEENELQFNSEDERQLFGGSQQQRQSIFEEAEQGSPETAHSVSETQANSSSPDARDRLNTAMLDISDILQSADTVSQQQPQRLSQSTLAMNAPVLDQSNPPEEVEVVVLQATHFLT